MVLFSAPVNEVHLVRDNRAIKDHVLLLRQVLILLKSEHQRAGAPLLQGQAEGVGAVQPGEEKAPG